MLQRGGIETWLLQVLRHLDRQRIQIDILVQTERPGAYDAEAKALGARIWTCPIEQRSIWHYGRQFKHILRENGPYDIVHSHVHHFSGLTLRLAQQMRIPVRIAHSHNDTSALHQSPKWTRTLYLKLMRRWIHRYATLGLTASTESAPDLFGVNWQQDSRWQRLFCGIDLLPFQHRTTSADVRAARAEFGIPEDALVLGHVGRFEYQKNHAFLLKIAEAVAQQTPQVYLLLVGDGPLQPEIKQQAAQSPLGQRILFVGQRSDVPRLMQQVMDVLVLPSWFEGLPIVGIEAQAAGLPIVLSDCITTELDAIPVLMNRLSLKQPAPLWADAILAVLARRASLGPDLGWQSLQHHPFNIVQSVKTLEGLYWQAVNSD
jgi:glycosyltransferase involved in cell wall biosynthesis